MSFNDLKLLDNGENLTVKDFGFSTSTTALDALGQYNLTTGVLNEARKLDQDLYAWWDNTSMKKEEIENYVKEKESSLDVTGIDSISQNALDMMIQDKKNDEKSAIYAQYRKDGFLSNLSYYTSAFVGQMLDPVALLTGVGLAKATASVGTTGMKAFAKSVATATTRTAKLKAGAKVGLVYGTAEALLTEPLFYSMAQMRQDNYGIDDSVLNIAFGAVAGSAFGSIGSAFSKVRIPDSIPDLKSEDTLQILKTAHNQAVVGDKVNIEPIIKVDPINNYTTKVKEANAPVKDTKVETVKDKTPKKEETPSVKTEKTISNMREVIADIRSETQKMRPAKKKVVEARLRETEKVLDKGKLPDYNDLAPSIKRKINNRELLRKDGEVRGMMNSLDAKPREKVEAVETIEEPTIEALEKIESEEFDAVYETMGRQFDNEFDELSDGEFDGIMESLRGCNL
jgi:hypothetical protein